MSKPNRK